MNGGSDPYKPYHFLKECNEKLEKMHNSILDNSRTITQEENMETRQMIPFENGQNSCGTSSLGKSYRFRSYFSRK